MPRGIAGLLIAAILAAAMSNLSAALNSLSSSSMMDLYLRFRPNLDENKRLKLSRLATVVWAVVLFALAVIALHRVGEWSKSMQIASVALWRTPGSIPTRSADKTRQPERRNHRYDLRLWDGTLFVAWHSRPLDMVGSVGTTVTFIVGYLASLLWTPTESL